MTRSLYRQLGDAQEAAARAGTPAPCTTIEPWTLWASDLLTATIERQLIGECRRCPVLEPCKTYRQDARTRGIKLTGVIAGVHLTLGVETRRTTTYRVGAITMHRALELQANGLTQAQIADIAQVTEATVQDAFQRHRDRLQELAGLAGVA